MKIPLEIVSSVIKEPYCKIDGIKDKIRSLTKDVMDMIYVVAAGNSSSSYDLQVDSEEELKQIREKTVKYVSEKVKEYIINDLLSGVSEEQGSFTIVSPMRICKYLRLITDKYLAILIGDFSKPLLRDYEKEKRLTYFHHFTSKPLLRDCDEIILNLFKHVIGQLYVASEENADNFEKVVVYMVKNITNIKHLYRIEPKYLFNLFRQIEKSGYRLIYKDHNNHSYYVVKSESKEPIIRKLKEDSPIKYYSSLNICRRCNKAYLSNKHICDNCFSKLEEFGDAFLISCSLLEKDTIDVGKVFEALVYLGLRINAMNEASLITHNIIIDNREYDILKLQLTYVDSNKESLNIEMKAIDVIECKLKAEDKDVNKLIEKLNSKTMRKLREIGVEINPYIVCIESEATGKDNIKIITLNDWKDLNNILFN